MEEFNETGKYYTTKKLSEFDQNKLYKNKNIQFVHAMFGRAILIRIQAGEQKCNMVLPKRVVNMCINESIWQIEQISD